MLRHTKTKNPASGLPVRGSVFALSLSDLVESDPHPLPLDYEGLRDQQAQYLTDIDDANGEGEHGAKMSGCG